ncbi:hypothetical protein J5226_10810 [Lysobacter sp. K5869]|uniref:hypothetical protein n=1 Tax=Lysobacter sp. K5869 TaxID=2820808 RepID=UPI001C05F218|nr:hypothetical protein [Lysobacter sp. K5869]QWP78843.1 hypothetical protein J5226_10810 [Lysobacter sp. K5869]
MSGIAYLDFGRANASGGRGADGRSGMCAAVAAEGVRERGPMRGPARFAAHALRTAGSGGRMRAQAIARAGVAAREV